MRFGMFLFGITVFSLLSISAVGNVTLNNFHTPTINPGESGKLCFTVENNYNTTMENVYLTVEIYKYRTEETSKNLNRISNPPVFVNNNQKIITYDESITAGHSIQISLQISTSKGTPQGTYLVRTKIEFILDNTPYMMESIGYFSDEGWMNYQLNTTYLPTGCSGIIPEPSFTVRKPIPMWPLYVLIDATVFFGFLAVLFYMQDTKRIPRLKR
jgi:hypothetical protein